MPGGFSNGFSNGFGPVIFTRAFGRRREKFFGRQTKEIQMESLVIRGTNASGLYTAGPQRAMYIQSISIDYPASGAIGTTVTVSGARTGAYTFNDNVNVNLRFKPNEDVYITTSNFQSNYGAIINYLEVGDASSYMETDISRSGIFGVPTPWRFRN